MNKNKIIKVITESLDNLSVVRISNRQKAEVIADELEKLFEQDNKVTFTINEPPRYYTTSIKGRKNDSN